MMPEDTPVWTRWLDKHKEEPNAYTYDVKVGEAVKHPEQFDENFATMAMVLSKKRIDVVITTDDLITVVEVKKLAGWTAIGQMLGYPVLFQAEFNPQLPVQGLLVCESMTLDTQTILDFYGIPYELMPLPEAS